MGVADDEKAVILVKSPPLVPFVIKIDAKSGDKVCIRYCPHPNCMAQTKILLAFDADRKGGAAPRVEARAHSASTCAG